LGLAGVVSGAVGCKAFNSFVEFTFNFITKSKGFPISGSTLTINGERDATRMALIHSRKEKVHTLGAGIGGQSRDGIWLLDDDVSMLKALGRAPDRARCGSFRLSQNLSMTRILCGSFKKLKKLPHGSKRRRTDNYVPRNPPSK
jgi:hypothetical protein